MDYTKTSKPIFLNQTEKLSGLPKGRPLFYDHVGKRKFDAQGKNYYCLNQTPPINIYVPAPPALYAAVKDSLFGKTPPSIIVTFGPIVTFVKGLFRNAP